MNTFEFLGMSPCGRPVTDLEQPTRRLVVKLQGCVAVGFVHEVPTCSSEFRSAFVPTTQKEEAFSSDHMNLS